MFKSPVSFLALMAIPVLAAGNAYAAAVETHLDANEFIYDQVQEKIIAKGAVQLVQAGRTLYADQIIYDVQEDLAIAQGDIRFTDEGGDHHYADLLELSDSMRQGIVQELYSELSDGSRMWAKKAIRETPQKHVLHDARYTPCQACQDDPDKTPTWALRASNVVHDKDEATIAYKNVRFEAWGTPIMYTPYFSHPDGSVKQKSGFLAPEIGFGSDYGFNFMTPYYWAIAPDMDATIGLRVFSKSAPQLNLEGRKRFEDAAIRIATSTTYSDRVDSVNGADVFVDEELRGHVEIESLWNINNHWRAGTDLKWASDEQYLDQYDISDEDILENRIYAERFDNRDYISAQLLAFQDLRLDEDVDQPNALPLAEMSIIGKPNSALGGRLKWDSSYLSLYRSGDDQDVNRLSSEVSWQRQDILPMGLMNTIDLSLRGDAYYTSDRDVAKTDPTENNSKFDMRAIPTVNIKLAYPLRKPVSAGHVIVKPRIGLTATPDIDNDSDIPNEDSIDSQINYTNLFDIDRFPGLDRVEDRTRVSYGVETGYYTHDGDEFTVALGQSYRFDDDNPFQNGSGFENQQSDLVGQIGASFDNHAHNLNYRFQLDGQKLNAERHEIYGASRFGNTHIEGNYLYEKGSVGTEFEDSREQAQLRLTQQLNQTWSISGAALYDFGVDPGLRESSVGIGYDDDCVGVTAEYQRDLQREASGSSDTTVLLRLRLKNLGEFETTAFDEGSDDNDNAEGL